MARKSRSGNRGSKKGRATRTRIDGRLADLVAAHVDALVAELTQAVRRQMADDLTRALGGAVASRGAASMGKLAARAKRRTIKPCIAPGCSNPSKGPRFHYLCDKHRGASKRDYEAWRSKKQDAAAG